MNQVLLAVGLGGVFLLMLGSVRPADWLIALFLGGLAALAGWASCRRSGERSITERVRLAGAPRFAVGLAIEVAGGVITVLRKLLGPGRVETGMLTSISAPHHSSAALALDGLVMSISPDSVMIDTDSASGRILMHAVEVASPEQIQRDIDRFYERYQKSFLP